MIAVDQVKEREKNPKIVELEALLGINKVDFSRIISKELKILQSDAL